MTLDSYGETASDREREAPDQTPLTTIGFNSRFNPGLDRRVAAGFNSRPNKALNAPRRLMNRHGTRTCIS
jgi:hypothetical protein